MVRDVTPADFAALLAFNAESVEVLSPLDLARIARLHNFPAYHRGIERDRELVAFLLAFREGVDYDSQNYQWFQKHRDTFLYIDRIVVRADQQRRYFGTELYRDVIGFAARDGCERVVCEFDVEPPNEGSRAFHERFGFKEVGSQWLNGGTKRVSLRELVLAEAD
jgi:predicted GNAT superfamily acetyltransferase